MDLHGQQIIGASNSAENTQTFTAKNPATAEELPTAFHESTAGEIAAALKAADGAFADYQKKSPEEIAVFLEAIADGLEALGDTLLERAHAETGLPMPRLTGERGRTVGQIRLFASVVREGSWVDARIDHANRVGTRWRR